jgi:ABC-2 type transport system ATP-binding protein
MAAVPVIEIEDLVVEYGRGAGSTRAVDGLSLSVNQGECVGFIGANGAGKSSTIKTVMGFIFPAAGKVTVFGSPAGTVESRRRIGYLPEVSLYYPFMKARELLELYGGLSGLRRRQLRERIPPLLEEVGLGGKCEVLLRNFTKRMQQLLGIAQAIIADPEALVFDELSSGLDPVGRFDLRQVLLRLKQEGRTIFFSSHELGEVESLCDRVVMIHRGRKLAEATVQELLKPLNLFEVSFRCPDGTPLPDAVQRHGPVRDGETVRVTIRDVTDYARAVEELAARGATILSTSSKTSSLEEHFISLVRGGEAGGA